MLWRFQAFLWRSDIRALPDPALQGTVLGYRAMTVAAVLAFVLFAILSRVLSASC